MVTEKRGEVSCGSGVTATASPSQSHDRQHSILSLAEQGSGLEGQLQCWSATQVISGSHPEEIKDAVTLSCKTQKGQRDQMLLQIQKQKTKSSCIYMSQNQVNNFCQPMTLVMPHRTAHGGILFKASLSTHCRVRHQ